MPSDRYQQLTALPPGRFIAKRLGLPDSRPLRRHKPAQPALAGPALLGGDGRLGDTVTTTLNAVSALLTTEALTSLGVEVAVNQTSFSDAAHTFLEDNGLM